MQIKIGGAQAYVDVSVCYKEIYVSSFWCEEEHRGKQHSRKLLEFVCQFADILQYDTRLTASAYDGCPKSNEQLVKYYRRFGFRKVKANVYRRCLAPTPMCRPAVLAITHQPNMEQTHAFGKRN